MVVALVAVLLAGSGCSALRREEARPPAFPPTETPPFQQVGKASLYAPEFQGRKTASGARFDHAKPTAAHRTLPLGTSATVTNLDTGRSTEVTINDRGPWVKGRVIDLSNEAARRIGLDARQGLAPVRVEATPTPPDGK